MGAMFHALGLLPGDELKEAKASDLVTGYTGQAGKKTREILKESRGGVLFIDEAYQLDPARGGHYMTEAVDELVGALTEEEFKGKILVILAGYDSDMENMLKTNPGLQSRFSERVHFHDFDANATVELLQLELSKRDIPLTLVPDLNDVCRLAQTLVDSDNFGNGRDVVTWADRVYKVMARKFGKKNTGRMATTSTTSSFSDVEEALADVLRSRETRSGSQTCTTAPKIGQDAIATQDSRKPRPPTANSNMVINQQVNDDKEEHSNGGVDESPSKEAPNLFDGMDSNLLRSLQNFVDEQGLGSQEGARRLAQLDPNSSDFAELVKRLERELGMSPAEAKAQLLDWQSKQEDLEEMVQEQKTKSRAMGARPIWRCGVCGRADKPWIACYVAPFIVRYEKIPVGEEE
jgi:SpoVK/Ycf46/Vps4 family AAA+-type ATPase